uniref:Geranylgeranyl diphosphate synthase 1 n=1 Tax=Eptatretus burgeri TaxID=7764 RepID=A0A8C4QE95_EPTBU
MAENDLSWDEEALAAGGERSEVLEEPASDDPMERVLLEPYNYLLQLPGKQIRSKLAEAFNYWLKIPDEKFQVIIEVIEMLHNASLLIDDIEDSSRLRRGHPVAHSIYGVPSVINSANYVYFLGLRKVLTLEHPQAVPIFCQQLLELHRGQGMDIFWRDSFQCPSEADYLVMVRLYKLPVTQVIHEGTLSAVHYFT